MKLIPRFTLAFILYAFVLLLGVGLLAYQTGRSALQATTATELQGTALRKEENLKRWIETHTADVAALAADPAVVTPAVILLQAAPDSAQFRAADQAFQETIQPRLASSRYLQVSLVSPTTGLVLASTAPEEVGRLQTEEPYFVNGRSTAYVEAPHFSNRLQGFVVTASAPIQSPQGEPLGLLAARLDLQSLNDLIGRRTNQHVTDEAYLVATSQRLVTRPRLLPDLTQLAQPLKSAPVGRCWQHESGVTESTDYRGRPVFVAYRWLPEQELCLVVKIDQAEALQPIRSFGGTIAVISAVGLLIAAGVATLLARSMTRPILALQAGVARLAQGELGVQLEVTAPDELGQLASEFNRMAQALAEQQTLLRQRAAQFFDLSLDLLCTLDPASQLLDLNPAWEGALGHARAALRGQNLESLLHPEDQALTRLALERIIRGGSGRFENRCRHQDGSYRWLAWVAVYASQEELIYAAARDITDRRLDEERLRLQTEELRRTNQELEQLGDIAAHDLQEPVQLVSKYVQLLARRYQGRLDAEADEFIDFALGGADRMLRLLADLRTYSEAASQPVELVMVPMETVFERAVLNLQVLIQQTGAVITHDPLPVVLGGSQQLVQLLQQLLSNALKFRGVEPPRLHLGVRQLVANWLFFVRDNGIGIDAQYTERIFGIFQRLHPQNRYPGTGLGLALCRKIIERHGGRIWVDSEPGKGATFYFTLQPAESWLPAAAPAEVVKPRAKDTVSDRARDLI